MEQYAQNIRNVELNKTELTERNKTLEKLVKELEWQLHEQEAVKNARWLFSSSLLSNETASFF